MTERMKDDSILGLQGPASQPASCCCRGQLLQGPDRYLPCVNMRCLSSTDRRITLTSSLGLSLSNIYVHLKKKNYYIFPANLWLIQCLVPSGRAG